MEMCACSCVSAQESSSGCIICGAPLRYHVKGEAHVCVLCGKEQRTHVECEAGHFVCDACHTAEFEDVVAALRVSNEHDPMALFERMAEHSAIHLHGPEHHVLMPCILLTAYRNAGGEIDLARALPEAERRGRMVYGGLCGDLGVCGAAAGAGIYASIVLGSTPLNGAVWHLPQQLVVDCLKRLAKVGGPRCCKRTSRLCIEEAVRFTHEELGVSLPMKLPHACAYVQRNKECIGARCPYLK